MQKKKKVGWGKAGAKPKTSTPLSVEELLKKKQEEEAAAAKVRDMMGSDGNYNALLYDWCSCLDITF